MFEYTMNYPLLLFTILAAVGYGILHYSYDMRYRRKFKEFRDEMHTQYLKLYKDAKKQIRIDIINESIKNGKCLICENDIEVKYGKKE